MVYLVISDSHGRNQNISEVMRRVGKVDGVFHAGDLQCPKEKIERITGCSIYAVGGNNDFWDKLPPYEMVTICGHKIGLVHGHRYDVYSGTDRLAYWGMEQGVELVIYGHTHMPSLTQAGNVTLLNPGSITLPRQDYRTPTYALIEFDREGGIHYTLCELKDDNKIGG